jgi:Family of unknown function (DUF5906)
MRANFLQAPFPLTKTVEVLPSGEVAKTPYPNAFAFTSLEEDVPDIKAFHAALVKHAASGACLLKGELQRPLVNESRAGSTNPASTTQFICLDIDGLPSTYGTPAVTITPDFLLTALNLHNVSHVLQWSASQGLDGGATLRLHIFMMLASPVAAHILKQWLIQLNHTTPLLHDAMGLTKTGNSLTWALDITACQNDKLLYIAPPVFKGMRSPMGKTPRISLVTRAYPTFTFPLTTHSTETNKALTAKRVLELREIAGLPARKFTYKAVSGTEILVKPDVCTITETRTERGFTYFNLNGGDSWAYYHPEDRADIIYNFKGEPAYLTKELLPDYWDQLTAQASRTTSQGTTYLIFLDKASSTYYRGTYDTATDHLDLHAAKNETQLRHFAEQYGVPLGSYIPEWDMTFNPHDNVRVDFTNRTINTFQLTPYMKATSKKVIKCPPTILRIIHHALGSDSECTEHFINWVAFILQERTRTLTAWVLHGTEGCLTGDARINFKRGQRNAGRDLTIEEAYEKWSGIYKLGQGRGKDWSKPHTTYAKAVKDGMTVGYHEVYDIVQSGVKPVWTLTTTTGRQLTATAKHPFMRPDGSFTELQDLTPDCQVVVEGVHNAHISNPQGRNKSRRITYSVPHHLYAWQHIINGKNYQRIHTARLVVEANMNGLSLEALIKILRTDPIEAACLKYLPLDVIVHHKDEDPSNDALSNLEVIDKLNHDQHHAKHVGLGTINTAVEAIASIVPASEQMTYDITMKAPYHNYVANGFVVHNTGKGIMMNRILRPIFGKAQTASRRMEEFNEPYNSFMKQCFLVFVDEVQTKALLNEKGVMAKLRNFITEGTVTIRDMYSAAREWENFTNWIFASNMPDPVAIPKEDRRFNVGKYQPKKLGMSDQELSKLDSELQAFHDYLLSYPVDKIAVATVLDNDDRNTMISISESSIDTVASAILGGDFEFLLDQLPATNAYTGNALSSNKIEDYKHALRTIMVRADPKTGKCNITRDELRVIFEYVVGKIPDSPNKFTSLLKHHRIHTKKVWCDDRAVHGIQTAFKDVAQFAKYSATYFPPPPKVTKPGPLKTKAKP